MGPPRALAVELLAHSIESSSAASGLHATIPEASLSKELDTGEKLGRQLKRAAQGRSTAALVSNSTDDHPVETRRHAVLRAAGLAPSPYDHHNSNESRRLVMLHTPSSLQNSEEVHKQGASRTRTPLESNLGTMTNNNDETFESIGYEPIHKVPGFSYQPLGDTAGRKNRLLPSDRD